MLQIDPGFAHARHLIAAPSGFLIAAQITGLQSARLPAGASAEAGLENQGMAFNLIVNGTRHTVDADPQTPLLWVIRDQVGLTGTKFSCGIGQCGACTLHVDGRPVRSCSVPASTAVGRTILTIEGLSPDGSHPIQLAWKELDAPQCGYCQSGMIMSTLALLRRHPDPTDADIDAEVTNACRCSTYHRVRKAIHLAADLMRARA
jgi:isoquinoline 1-oxidoreductase alpha subunit